MLIEYTASICKCILWNIKNMKNHRRFKCNFKINLLFSNVFEISHLMRSAALDVAGFRKIILNKFQF